MSSSVLTFSYNRRKALDTSEPLYMQELAILWHRPELEADLAGFIKPFDTEVRSFFDVDI